LRIYYNYFQEKTLTKVNSLFWLSNRIRLYSISMKGSFSGWSALADFTTVAVDFKAIWTHKSTLEVITLGST